MVESKYIAVNELAVFVKGETCALNFMHVNCRSLNKNYTALINLLQLIPTPLTAIAVTETWLTNANEANHNIEGYKFIHQS